MVWRSVIGKQHLRWCRSSGGSTRKTRSKRKPGCRPDMLALYSNRAVRSELPSRNAEARLPADIVWIDLLNPAANETAFVERTTGLAVPSVEELSEIESSSRLRAANGALYLSAPLVRRGVDDEPVATVVGFVLTPERLITVRFAELPTFAEVQRSPLPAD